MCRLPRRVRETLLCGSGVVRDLAHSQSLPKKKKKAKKNQPQNQTKYQGAHVETGRSWRVRGAREVSVPQTPRSQIFSGRRGGCQPGRTWSGVSFWETIGDAVPGWLRHLGCASGKTPSVRRTIVAEPGPKTSSPGAKMPPTRLRLGCSVWKRRNQNPAVNFLPLLPPRCPVRVGMAPIGPSSCGVQGRGAAADSFVQLFLYLFGREGDKK